MKNHVVKPGECLMQIAKRYGLPSWKVIYDHPSNADLRRKRPDPGIIQPGDRVSIPSAKTKEVSVPTGQPQRISAQLPRRWLRLVVRDGAGKPIAKTPFQLDVGGKAVLGMTDGSGLVSCAVPVGATQGILVVGTREWRLSLGELNPVTNVPANDASGVQGRLRNPGYDVEVTGTLDPPTRAALRAFQRANGLTPSGDVDDATRARLKQQHGR